MCATVGGGTCSTETLAVSGGRVGSTFGSGVVATFDPSDVELVELAGRVGSTSSPGRVVLGTILEDRRDVVVEVACGFGASCVSIVRKLPTRSTAGVPNAPFAHASNVLPTRMTATTPPPATARFRYMDQLPAATCSAPIAGPDVTQRGTSAGFEPGKGKVSKKDEIHRAAADRTA